MSSDADVSPQSLISCDSNNMGCDGGFTLTAWSHFQKVGAPNCTSGCLGGCMPYQSQKCYENTPGSGVGCENCSTVCLDTGLTYTADDKFYVSEYWSLPSRYVEAIQQEILQNGPVAVQFSVYENFFTFFRSNPTGIYTHTNGSLAGGHVVKIVGWGVDNSTASIPYWIVQNSWGSWWGEKGFFKVVRGKSVAGFEDFPTAACPKGTGCKRVRPLSGNLKTSGTAPITGAYVKGDLNGSHISEAIAHFYKHRANSAQASRIVGARTQVVAGLNIELDIATPGSAIHTVKIFRDLMGELHIVS